MWAVIKKSFYQDVIVLLINRCVLSALNRIARLVRHDLSLKWTGFWDKNSYKVIAYLSRKNFSSVTGKLIWARSTKSISIFFNMIKKKFLTSSVTLFNDR